jgi:hypothetical protein
MTSFKVTPLVCPDCGGPLDGLRYDKVFCCAPCGVAFEFGGGTPMRYPLRFAMGELPAERSMGLPFWRLEIEATAAGEEEEPGLGWVRKRLAGLESVWVAAFFCTGAAYHGDPGFDLTDSNALPLAAAESPDGVSAVGITRSRTEAARYVELYVANRFAPGDGARGIEISVRIRSAELWILPFALDAEARRLTSCVTGASYPSSIANDLYAMLGR